MREDLSNLLQGVLRVEQVGQPGLFSGVLDDLLHEFQAFLEGRRGDKFRDEGLSSLSRN